jgi:hypothetical protein
MSEYMLLIRNRKNRDASWTEAKDREFLRACEQHIAELQRNDNLVAAQPLVRDGVIIANDGEHWSETPLEDATEIQVGYYHLRAASLDEAVAIAKRNPEFQYTTTARVEVRPLKTSEPRTGFDYPTGTPRR